MKRIKKLLSILLGALLLLSTFLFAVPVSAASTYETGDKIEFGTFPQSKVEETPKLKIAANAASWKSYNYYSGTGERFDGNMTPSNYMQFADFFCGGVKYRAVKFSAYRPDYTGESSGASHSYQDKNGYTLNNTYYFKYDALIWRILDPSEGFVLCENVIDAQAYQNTILSANNDYWQDNTQATYANDYATSTIRNWLNNDFYETAFNADQKANIKTSLLNDNSSNTFYAQYISAPTNDKIFLLSEDDAYNASYGFSEEESTRIVNGTDYAKCQGLWGSDDLSDSFLWWLRSPGHNSGCAGLIYLDGNINDTLVSGTAVGIRPACKISTLKSDTSFSYKLFSGGTYEPHSHDYTSTVTTPATCTRKGTMTYTCTCGDSYTKDIEIDPTNHADLDQNGDCPRCGKHIKDMEKPTDPTTKPSEEKPAEKLNIFQRIIQWFRNFFARLFGR